MQQAIREADSGSTVIQRITTDRLATVYCYIQIRSESSSGVRTVLPFVEKPNAYAAQKYINEGDCYCNAGMFVLKSSAWPQALSVFRPDIANTTVTSWNGKSQNQAFVRPDKAELTAIPTEFIDYAGMERCPNSNLSIKMVTLDAGWIDLFAWYSAWNVQSKDDQGNAHFGDVITTNSRNTLLYASNRLVSLVGVQGLIVIETPVAVLVSDKSRSQDVNTSSLSCKPLGATSIHCNAKCIAHVASTTALTKATALMCIQVKPCAMQ